MDFVECDSMKINTEILESLRLVDDTMEISSRKLYYFVVVFMAASITNFSPFRISRILKLKPGVNAYANS